MIEKIQNLIEDNTSVDVTRNQIIIGLAVMGAFFLLIVFFMLSSGGPKDDSANYVPPAPSADLPAHVPGQ